MIRLLALDIDGTLLDSHGSLPEANRRAVAEAIDARRRGRRWRPAAATISRGRSSSSCRSPLTLILSNGAVVKTQRAAKRSSAGCCRARSRTTSCSARRSIARVRRSCSIGRAKGRWCSRRSTGSIPRHAGSSPRTGRFVAESKPLEDCLSEDPVQVMFTGGCSLHARASRRCSERSSDGLFSVALTEYQHRDFSLVDVIRAGVCKGTALEDWARTRGYARERGDGDRRQSQ